MWNSLNISGSNSWCEFCSWKIINWTCFRGWRRAKLFLFRLFAAASDVRQGKKSGCAKNAILAKGLMRTQMNYDERKSKRRALIYGRVSQLKFKLAASILPRGAFAKAFIFACMLCVIMRREKTIFHSSGEPLSWRSSLCIPQGIARRAH